MEQQDKIIKARIQKQEKRVARAQAELARLKESEKSQARKRRTKAMIILGATLERAVPMAARAELHSLILQHERDSEWVCRLVLALAARLSPPSRRRGRK
jgi:reverse gyrase